MKRTIRKIDKRVHSYFCIEFDFNQSVDSVVKKIPSVKYVAKQKYYVVKISADSALHIYNLIKDYKFRVIEKETEDIIKKALTKMKSLYVASTSEGANFDVSLNMELLPFQKAGALYLTKVKRGFLADEMGLGKTVQSIGAVVKENNFPCVVVCPSVAKNNWKKEINKWTSDISIQVLESDSTIIGGRKWYIINYDIVHKFVDYFVLASPKCVILDECHYIKSPKARRTVSVKKLCSSAQNIYMLSGTVIENRPKELISQLTILRRLDDFGGYHFFIKRYCEASHNGFGIDKNGAANLEELNKKLRSICFIRRKKKDVQKELPKKTKKIIEVDIDDREIYNLARDNTPEWIKKHRDLYKEKDLFDEMELEEDDMNDYSIELQRISAMRVQSYRSKYNSIKKAIDKLIDIEDKIVVFAYHRPLQEKLISEYKDISCYIKGGMSTKEKNFMELEFEKNKRKKLIICSLIAASTAITLTAARTVLKTELGWTPALHDQAEDRVHRISQTRESRIIYLLGRETIDVDMMEIIESKREVVDNTLDGAGAEIMNKKIIDELINKVKRKYGKAKN